MYIRDLIPQNLVEMAKAGPIVVEHSLSHQQSKKFGKDQESMQSSTSPDQRYNMVSDKNTIKHHKREPRGHPFPSR